MIPGENKRDLIYTDHMSRYMFAGSMVRDKIVLDAACGSGYGAYYLAACSARWITAIDISNEAIAYARSNYTAPCLSHACADIRRLPLSASTFDCIVAFEILEHIEEHEIFMAEIKRVIKPGGILIVSTPDMAFYKSQNAFHKKELTNEGFIDLVLSHFRHVDFFFQSDQMASVIFKKVSKPGGMGQQDNKMPSEVFLWPCRVCGEPGEFGRFNIAICSDEKFPSAENVLLLNNTKDWFHLEGDLKTTHKTEKDALNTRLNEITRRLANIENSRAYKLASFLSRMKRFLWR